MQARNDKGKLTVFSNHDGSLLRQQPKGTMQALITTGLLMSVCVCAYTSVKGKLQLVCLRDGTVLSGWTSQGR